jgi:hypothetical protein
LIRDRIFRYGGLKRRAGRVFSVHSQFL